MNVQYFLVITFFPLSSQNGSYPKFLSYLKLNGEMSMEKKTGYTKKMYCSPSFVV